MQISTELQDLVGIWTDIGSVHLLSGNFEEAEKSYKKAISMACERVPVANVYFEMGRMYVEWRKFPDAVHAFKNAHSQLAFDVRLKNSVGYETSIIWYIGYSAFQSGYGDETIAYMAKVLEESHEGDAWYAETHLILAHQYNKNGDTSKAREHYGRVIMDPNAGQQRVRIAEEYLAALPLDS